MANIPMSYRIILETFSEKSVITIIKNDIKLI